MTVDHFPGFLGISVTGHVQAGECSSDCVRREVEEELGIKSSLLRFDFMFSFFQEAILNETYIDRQFNDIYVTYVDIQPELIQFDRSEVSEVKFVSFGSFQELVRGERVILLRYI